MTRRKRLLWRTILLCSVPVVLVSAWVVWQGRATDAPYVAGEETEGITRTLDRNLEERPAGLRFTEVTAESGIDFEHFPFRRSSQLPEDMGPGAAWGDYDGDGDDDLFLVNFAAPLGVSDEEMARSSATDRLYRNRGDGSFEDVTAEAGVGRPHRGMGAAWGDHDSDGDLDLFVTSWGENVLWENRGDGTFADATERAGLGGAGFWTGAAWADFDLDADLDLYVCGYVRYETVAPDDLAGQDSDFPFTLNPSSWPPHPNRFYVNRGDGTFEEKGAELGVAGTNGKSLCAAWTDLDADGLPDLYVANDVSDNVLYLNQGDGTFRDVSYEAVVADYRGAMGVAVGDWDGDLDLDLFITHWIAQENALYTNHGSAGKGLLFVDDADRVGLGQIALDFIGWGTAFVDLDNDGWLDLFAANGSTFQERERPERLVAMHPHLYWNRGAEEGFFEVGEAAGLWSDPAGVGRGAAVSDYDGDGDLDLLICRHGGRTRLLRNDTASGHFAKFRLRAKSGHPSGRGTRLTVHAAEEAWLREAGGGPSYLSQHGADVAVGVGGAARLDSVVVTWSGGPREVWTDLAVDRTWLLLEGEPPRELEVETASGAPTRKTSEISEHAVVANVATNLSREEVRRFWKLKKRSDGELAAGEWEAAIATLEEMHALDPAHEDALYRLGNCYFEVGRHAEAKRAWERLLEVNPASSRAWTRIGTVHASPEAGELFDLEAAAQSFEAAHRLNPEESGPLLSRGEVELARGDLDAAERTLSSARGMNPQAASAWYLSGYVAWKRGEEERAREYLDEAVRSLEAAAPIRGVLGEGDTKSAEMTRIKRRAGRHQLFAACVDALREDEPPHDVETAYGRVDDLRADLGTR